MSKHIHIHVTKDAKTTDAREKITVEASRKRGGGYVREVVLRTDNLDEAKRRARQLSKDPNYKNVDLYDDGRPVDF